MLSSKNYIVLDAAITNIDINEANSFNTGLPLFRGNSQQHLVDVSPYLFTIQKGSEFEDWYINSGWGRNWGIIMISEFPSEQAFRHIRRFLIVKTESNKELYFRFYDPRVLRIFLPTCDTKQLKEFFGPIEYFICEDEDPAFGLIFSLSRDHKLITERLTKEEIFGLAATDPSQAGTTNI